jgi:serine/threonine-protein kinase
MSEEIGKRIGDYQVISELGSGGMGRVYKVRNVLSDRIEAMKILLPDVANRQELAARFLREIKVLAALNHPNIAALRTALTVDNQLVMIMEYVEGTTLADRVTHGPIPVADALNYMDQVLNALSYAHAQHVIHRDIKPANIILTPQGVIKVMDFGIARSGEDRSLTMTGTTLGSLSYMSPEQVKGESADARSDLYSVGISLYELVTGQRPFQAHSDYSIMAAHVKEAPKPPIELQEGLPPALNEIILMAIAKDPAQRFQTADAFRNALHNVEVPATAQPAAVAPVVESDAVTATMAAAPVTAVPAASQSTVPASARTPTPIPAKVTPISMPTPATIPMPPPHKTHRGLYMTLGALVVLVVLVAAGIYVPRMSKTQATSSPAQTGTSEQPQAASQSTGATSQDSAQATPVTPSTLDAASSSNMAQPSAGTSAAAAPSATASPTPATMPAVPSASTATPSQPHAPQPRKSSASGGMMNAAMKEADNASTMASPATTAAPASAASDMDELEDQAQQLSTRAGAVDASLDQLQQQQSNAGYGMRGDIVAKRASMKANMAKAESAVQQKDPVRAKKYLGMAQSDIESLEHFLGH